METNKNLIITVSKEVNDFLHMHYKDVYHNGDTTVWDTNKYYRHESWPEGQWEVRMEQLTNPEPINE